MLLYINTLTLSNQIKNTEKVTYFEKSVLKAILSTLTFIL
ncbi:MAG: hypothetical protein RL308_973 [Bacteroidota bacterium]|jgi:hypothetical protein